MERAERIKRAGDLYHQLANLEHRLSEWVSAPSEARPRQNLMCARAQVAVLEHQISLLRLLQSENRLRQQLWIAIPTVLSGIAGTLLLQYFKMG